MEQPTEFVVSFSVTRQISPDDYEVIRPALKVTPSTTIAQILEWYNDLNAGQVGERRPVIGLSLDQLDQVELTSNIIQASHEIIVP